METPNTGQTERLAIAQAINTKRLAPVQIAAFAICFILSMLEGFDVLAISYASEKISEQLQLAPDQLGILFSAGLLGMMLGALFLAALSDIFGRRRMILAALFISGVSMLATGLADSLWTLAFLRLCTGLGVGVLLATVTAVAAEFMPERYRSFAVNAAISGYPTGAVLGGVIAAGMIPAYGWPSIFYGGGALTLLMMVAAYFLLPESLEYLLARQPRNALEKINHTLGRLRQPPLQALESEPFKTRIPGPSQLLSGGFRTRTLLLWSCFGLSFATLYFLFSWIPKIVSAAGADAATSIYALTLFNVGALVGILLLGGLSVKKGLGRIVGLFFFLGAVFMLAFPLIEGNAVLLLCAILGLLVQGGFVGLYAAAAAIYPAEIRATGVGWGIGLGRIGAVIGPYLAGVLFSQDVSMIWLLLVFAIPLAFAGLSSRFLGV